MSYYADSPLNTLKHRFHLLPEYDKMSFVRFAKITLAKPSPKTVTACPHCQSDHFVKNGFKYCADDSGAKTQRYLCRGCGKSFVENTGTILYGSKRDLSTWKEYIHCLIKKETLRDAAAICGISLATAFAWRHKILDTLQYMMEDITLDGVVQADETFFNISRKGAHRACFPEDDKDYGDPLKVYEETDEDLAKQQAERAILKAAKQETQRKRGISDQKVAVVCAVSLNRSIAKAANTGRTSYQQLKSVLDGKIKPNSILVSDSAAIYKKFAKENNLEHHAIPRGKHKQDGYHLAYLGSYHAKLKNMIENRFKCVATKYLNNYLAYHNFIASGAKTNAEKETLLLDFIRNTPCVSKVRDFAKRPAFPFPMEDDPEILKKEQEIKAKAAEKRKHTIAVRKEWKERAKEYTSS